MRHFELFTDAASYNNGQKDPNKPQHSYSAALLTYKGDVVAVFGAFNPNTTNNFGEINAIRIGLIESIRFIIEEIGLKSKDFYIDLYSDSEICVKGINEWMPSWKNRASSDGTWYSSKGEKVANQEIFKDIDYILNSKGTKKYLFKRVGESSERKYNINIYHIRGHINTAKSKDIEKAMKTFKRNNGFEISESKLNFIVNYNNKVDRVAVNNLSKILKDGGDL